MSILEDTYKGKIFFVCVEEIGINLSWGTNIFTFILKLN